MSIKQQSGVAERKQDLTGDGGEYIAARLAANKDSPRSTDNSSAVSDVSNILNAYRSVTYHFTIAALTQDNLTYPKSYRDTALKYVILSSKGKGPNAISSNIVPIKTEKSVPDYILDEEGKLDSVLTKKVAGEDDVSGVDIVDGFNKLSPGQFELYIDDLEIDSIMAPNEQTGTSLSTSVRFDVFEPLSVNGFIEALHTSAIAAGWSGYLNAPYLLKIDFIGYPDNVDLPTAETIKATKYIPIKFTGAEMEVTEQGTRYRCKAIPFTETGFGNPNQIYTDISFSGNTVKSVLENLFTAINKSVDERQKKEQKSDSTNILKDKYEIYFPKDPAIGETLKIEKTDDGNKIASENINQNLRDNSIYKFPAKNTPAGAGRGNAQAEQFRLNPQVSQIQFAKDSQITDIITAVIRDSNYLKKILENPHASKDKNGMIDYFQIVLNMIPLGLDKTTNAHKFTYQFLVVPYKVHYSKLPTQQSKSFSAKELVPFVKRTYNYIYTGKNIDVLNFKLNFNTLFFQASNPKMGNSDQSETASAAGPSGNQNKSIPKDAASDAKSSQQDIAPIISNGPSSSFGGRAGPARSDPYYQLAFNAHQAILESVNLLTADIDIVGDPFYLSSSGLSNYFANVKQLGLTEDGEANPAFAPVLCRVNFQNPVDIDPVTGQYSYAELVSFSGVYQVIKCKNMFRNGSFVQQLKLIRFSGQVDDDEPSKDKEKLLFTNDPKKGEQPRKDSAGPDVPKQGVKSNDIDLQSMIKRGFPEASIPGPEANPLNQIAKAAFGAGALLAGVDLLKGSLKLDLTSVAGLAGVAVGASALLQQAGDVAKSILPGNASDLLSSDVTKSLSGSVSQVSDLSKNLGVSLPASANDILKTANSLAVKDGSGNPILTAAAALDPAGAISNVKDKIGNLTSLAGGGLSAAAKNAVIADAKAKGIPIDQALRNASLFGVNLPGVAASNGSIAAKLGLDPSSLSKLTGLDSNIVDKMKQAAESIPKNTDLGKIKNLGIIMGDMSADSFKNLPAIPPILKAPLAALPGRSVASTLTAEQRTAVIADAKAKGIPIDQALRNASTFGINLKGLTPEAQAIAISNNPQALAGNVAALGALGISGADIISGKFDTISKQLKQMNPEIPSLNDVMAGLKGTLLSADKFKTGVANLSAGIGSSLGGITGGLAKIGSSVEGLAGDIQSSLGNPGTNLSLSNMGKTAIAQFGSLSSSVGSPLNKLMNTAVNNLGDPNAPPYTGDDPIVRSRLGLPPLTNSDDGDFA
jgi:hypothetical protein